MNTDNYYDDIATGYDRLHKNEQLQKLSIIIRRLRTEALAEGPLLDVGCGTGFSLDIIAEAISREVHGVDPSKGMISNYQGTQTITQAGAEALPYPDNWTSATISVTAIQNFEDIPRGVAEMRRVSKEGAPIIISCLKKSGKLKEVSEILAENLQVEEAIEEEKDIIFCCRKERL